MNFSVFYFESKVISGDYVPYSPSILDICRVDGMVILRVISLYGRVLLSSNNGNIMENNTCHNDVTCPLWGDPDLTQALEYVYGHLNLGSSPAVGRIKTLLGPRLRVRVRIQQKGLTWIASISPSR